MDNLNSLLEKVNTKTGTYPIFFVCNDAERAFGLEKLIENYHIVCIDDNKIIDYLKDDGVNIFCLERQLDELDIIFRNSNRLLQHEVTRRYIKNVADTGYFMFFKIAPNLERTSQNYGFKILNTSSKLNRKFELKLSQYDNIKNLDIRLPQTCILNLEDADYKSLTEKLSSRFVVQFNRGHTGKGTVIINSKYELDEIKSKFPKRKVRIARYVKGKAYTLNACVTRFGICWGGLSYQITGVEECTKNKSATVGNDWLYPANLSQNTKAEIGKFTKNIGLQMKKNGFLGMFGIDLVVEFETKKPYVIEINARQPASIPLFTKLQVQKEQIPLKLLAIAEFLDIEYKIDVEKYNLNASDTFEAAQLFCRNQFDSKAKVIGGVKPGVYRLVGDNSAYDWSNGKPDLKKNVIILDENKDKPLIYKSESYAVDGFDQGGMLILCAKEGKTINEGNEVARLQVKHTLLDDNGKIRTWVREVVKGLKKYILLKEKK